jgi:hypothetical protein
VRSHVALHLSTHAVLNGRSLSIRGRVRPAGPHQIKLVVRGPRSEAARLTTKANGIFVHRWSPERIGTYEVHGYDLDDQGSRGSVSVARRLTSFDPALVSYYGPGLYGGATACGGVLRPGTLGPPKTLPCGTLVSLRYRARAITVPVIDRPLRRRGRVRSDCRYQGTAGLSRTWSIALATTEPCSKSTAVGTADRLIRAELKLGLRRAGLRLVFGRKPRNAHAEQPDRA